MPPACITLRLCQRQKFRPFLLFVWLLFLLIPSRQGIYEENCGHQRESAHYRYDVPFVDEIIRAKDITWRYYQAIMEGREFFIPTTVFDIYEGLMNHWDKFPDLLRHAMADELGSAA